ncbi:unnamed protein product [Rhizoctonia solani]|uniref:Uncharacterized protein n=1 Tax=Rhizoctonia solani TaxID=456999 RepID=A0A8H3DM72_9AGAM|nr:unnamed protein product [Rhizoctonia solani]
MASLQSGIYELYLPNEGALNLQGGDDNTPVSIVQYTYDISEKYWSLELTGEGLTATITLKNLRHKKFAGFEHTHPTSWSNVVASGSAFSFNLEEAQDQDQGEGSLNYRIYVEDREHKNRLYLGRPSIPSSPIPCILNETRGDPWNFTWVGDMPPS